MDIYMRVISPYGSLDVKVLMAFFYVFIIEQVKHWLAYLHTLYFSLMHPYLSYGIAVWVMAKLMALIKEKFCRNEQFRRDFNAFYTATLIRYSSCLEF